MIVPHTPLKGVKSVKFPKWIVSSFIVLNLIILSAICAFGVSYHWLNEKLDTTKTEYQALQDLKENQEKQLNEYKANEQEIKDRINSLKDLQNKLKKIIDSTNSTYQPSSSVSRLASRGTNPEMSNSLSYPDEIEFESIQDIYSTVDGLVEDINDNIAELNEAIDAADKRMMALRAIPSVFPVSGHITSLFGTRKNPFASGYEFHTGLDIANSRGTPIRAAANGVVTEAGWDSGGYGILVTINHGNGYQSLYGHNCRVAVKVGQRVERGQIIAYMGSTGRATGNHCHFEIRYNGRPINPYSIKQ